LGNNAVDLNGGWYSVWIVIERYAGIDLFGPLFDATPTRSPIIRFAGNVALLVDGKRIQRWPFIPLAPFRNFKQEWPDAMRQVRNICQLTEQTIGNRHILTPWTYGTPPA